MKKLVEAILRFLKRKSDKQNTLYHYAQRAQEKEKPYLKRSSYHEFLEWMETDRKQVKGNSEKRFYQRFWISFALIACAVLLSWAMGNWLLAIPIGLLMGSLPFLQVSQASYMRKLKELDEEELSLSVLSAQYLNDDNLEEAAAVALPYLEGIVKEDMGWFLLQNRYVDANQKKLLNELSQRAFREREDHLLAQWYQAMAKAQDDLAERESLFPIVEQMGERRIATREFAAELKGVKKEFYVMFGLLLGARPLLLFINQDWYLTMRTTTAGQAVTFAAFSVLCFCLHRYFKLRKAQLSETILPEKSLFTKPKDYTVEDEIALFVGYLRRELKRTRDLTGLLDQYSFLCHGKLKEELILTVADMKTGNLETALLRLDQRFANPAMSDICRGLCAFLQGDLRDAYWQVVQRKLLDEKRLRRKEANHRQIGKIHALGFVMLSSMMGVYLTLLMTEVIQCVTLLFQ